MSHERKGLTQSHTEKAQRCTEKRQRETGEDQRGLTQRYTEKAQRDTEKGQRGSLSLFLPLSVPLRVSSVPLCVTT
jgi:hypothetical protein